MSKYTLTRTSGKNFSLTKIEWPYAPFPNDVSFYAKSRSGLSLVDDFGNDATIIPACLDNTAVTASYLALRTGIVPASNTLMIIRGSYTLLTGGEGNGSELYIITADYGGVRWGMRWGDHTGYSVTTQHGSSNVLADNNWHTFIMYNRKFWLCDPDISLADADIIQIINAETPLIDMTGTATWVAATQEIRLLCNYAYSNPAKGQKSLTWIGTITDGEITWQKKYVFTTHLCAYDIIDDGARTLFLDSTGATTHSGANMTTEYNEYGWDMLGEGHTSCYLAGTGVVSIPVAENGYITTAPPTYVILNNHPGNTTQHNLADSLIEFTGALWDRSNTDIYEDECRSSSFYDAVHPKRWHITELNNLLFTEWIKANYLGRIFVHEYPNSCQIEDKTLLNEIFTYGTNKTGSNYNRVLQYTDDYDIIVL